MNKMLGTIITTLTLIACSGYSEGSQLRPIQQVVTLDELQQEMLNQFIDGNLEQMALECPKGSTIPLKLFLKGNLLELKQDGNANLNIHVLDTFFVRKSGTEFLFSHDLQEWKGIADFVTGDLSVCLSLGDELPNLTLGADLKKR